jgi:spore cortex formation protein SpoVR/YcgB (stage V sporulation)
LAKLIAEEDQKQREMDIILKKTSRQADEVKIDHEDHDDMEDEENLLYFIMKKSPNLERWKREILRIVYKVNQYFYPQGQTKNLNEGMASFVHYYTMTRLEEKGMLSPDAYLNFLDHHSGVIFQPTYDKRYYSGFNPYALGFAILRDIKRICTEPTEEDKEWFPQLIGVRWQDAIKEAVFEHRDDSFVAQYLSPKVIRDQRLFTVSLDYSTDEQAASVSAVVSEIHDDIGYKNIRSALARSMERINFVPQIQVVSADLEGDRTLKLKYVPYKGRQLALEDAETVTNYIDYLWGYAVQLEDGN